MDKHAEVIALLSNAVLNSLVILNKCLLNNGGLRPGQFSQALKDTLNPPDADWNRLDYTFFRQLAQMLDEAETRDRK
jgi:hypothetical protein